MHGISAPGRGDLSPSRLHEHLRNIAKCFIRFGIRPGALIASALPDGPDSTTAAMTAKQAGLNFITVAHCASPGQYQSWLLRSGAKLLLLPSGVHPVRDAARDLGIPIANVLRHFEAGLFTLEMDHPPSWPIEPSSLTWKHRGRGVPLVLIAPGQVYRRLASRLDATSTLVGITAPGLEHMPLPHTVEHLAAECLRLLRGYRPHGPYALAGWRADAAVALEMARVLEEEGEKVVFVAMLDASSLFAPAPVTLFTAVKTRLRKYTPPPDFMAEVLRRYHPRPWFGKILHLCPHGQTHDWSQIAPQGVAIYDAPAEMLAEPNVHIVASILAAELLQYVTMAG